MKSATVEVKVMVSDNNIMLISKLSHFELTYD